MYPPAFGVFRSNFSASGQSRHVSNPAIRTYVGIPTFARTLCPELVHTSDRPCSFSPAPFQ